MMEEIIWEVYDANTIKVVYWVFVVFLAVNGVKEHQLPYDTYTRY